MDLIFPWDLGGEFVCAAGIIAAGLKTILTPE
jgi:hypothetical protein